jgi:3-dehydroquinate synthase
MFQKVCANINTAQEFIKQNALFCDLFKLTDTAMQSIETPGYTIYFNSECYDRLQEMLLPENYSIIFVLADSNTATHCLPGFLAQVATEIPIEIIEVEPGEENKSIETCVNVWYALSELGADRKSLIINLGGGMVTDLGGFVASTFKRGIDFINVPTSLLAMVDASIGGKTGVDLGGLKNQVGLINNPVAVLIDVQFLETLPAEQMRSGLAEMFKHGLIAGRNYWNSLIALSDLTTDDMAYLIKQSIEIKNNIVQQDPYEKSVRKLLNFGHTMGHAIESYHLENPEKKTLLHGEAIAIGMILESYFSLEKNMLAPEEYREIKAVIMSVFKKVNFTTADVEAITGLLVHDKKNEFGVVQFVLPERIGKAKIGCVVENELIYKAFLDYES